MGNCAGGFKTKAGPTPEPVPAKEEDVVMKTDTEEKKVEDRDVEIKADDSGQSLGHLLDSHVHESDEVKSDVKDEEKEHPSEIKHVVEEQYLIEEVKKEETKETSEAATAAAVPAESTKEEVEKKE